MTEKYPSTETWLRKLGAVRPMAPADATVLVLGNWTHEAFPIKWRLIPQTREHGDFGSYTVPAHEEWRLFGHLLVDELTREDVERILESLNQKKD